jgi:hypothetical protein
VGNAIKAGKYEPSLPFAFTIALLRQPVEAIFELGSDAREAAVCTAAVPYTGGEGWLERVWRGKLPSVKLKA